MNIELIKFYEIARSDEKQHLIGTLHLHFKEIGLHVKGITVFRKKNFWHFRLPGRKAFDPILGKEINYACVLFDEREKNEVLLNFLKTEGRKFVEDYLISTPQPSFEASKQAKACPDAPMPKKGLEAPLKKAEVKPALKPSSFTKLAALDFVDPPRKPAFTKSKAKFSHK